MAIRSNQAPSSPLAFDDLTTAQAIGPGKAYASQGRRDDAAGIPLSSLDRETSKLLPAKKRSHHVWVQGKLAPVRSVSIANLRGAAATATTPPPLPDNNPVLLVASPCVTERGPSPARSPGRFDRGVGASVDNNEKRRRSLDDGGAESDASENERIVTARDTQLRGYGIGGAGNIRRPTDVIHGPNRPSSSRRDMSESPAPFIPDADTLRITLRDLLRRRPNNRNKSKDASRE